MQWAQRRKAFIALSIAASGALVCGALWFGLFYRAPSCTDGVQNNDERGVDCGGSCARLCAVPRVDPLWARAVRVADGVYHGVALIRNPEQGASGTDIEYRYSLYDAQGILVAERRGALTLQPNEVRVLFESSIITGSQRPVRAVVSLNGGEWERGTRDASTVSVIPGVLDSGARTLTATLVNDTPLDVRNVVANALLFDSDGILVTASETRVPLLRARSRTEVVFTWIEPFARPIGTTDVLVREDDARRN